MLKEDQSYYRHSKNAPKKLRQNPVFSEIFSFALLVHAFAEDEIWRRRLVSVSATPARDPTGKPNAPPILPDFARVPNTKTKISRTQTQTRTYFFFGMYQLETRFARIIPDTEYLVFFTFQPNSALFSILRAR